MLNADVAKRRTDAISRGVGMQTQIYVDRALNSEVWDIEGNFLNLGNNFGWPEPRKRGKCLLETVVLTGDAEVQVQFLSRNAENVARAIVQILRLWTVDIARIQVAPLPRRRVTVKYAFGHQRPELIRMQRIFRIARHTKQLLADPARGRGRGFFGQAPVPAQEEIPHLRPIACIEPAQPVQVLVRGEGLWIEMAPKREDDKGIDEG